LEKCERICSLNGAIFAYWNTSSQLPAIFPNMERSERRARNDHQEGLGTNLPLGWKYFIFTLKFGKFLPFYN